MKVRRMSLLFLFTHRVCFEACNLSSAETKSLTFSNGDSYSLLSVISPSGRQLSVRGGEWRVLVLPSATNTTVERSVSMNYVVGDYKISRLRVMRGGVRC